MRRAGSQWWQVVILVSRIGVMALGSSAHQTNSGATRVEQLGLKSPGLCERRGFAGSPQRGI